MQRQHAAAGIHRCPLSSLGDGGRDGRPSIYRPGQIFIRLPISSLKSKNISEPLKPGTWMRATGYDEFYLSEKRHPTRWDLDEATADSSCEIDPRSGHAHVLNISGPETGRHHQKHAGAARAGLWIAVSKPGSRPAFSIEMNAVLSEAHTARVRKRSEPRVETAESKLAFTGHNLDTGRIRGK